MKKFIKSAFFMNLLIVLFFSSVAIYAATHGQPGIGMFFGIPAFIFAMILPACSTSR